MKTIKIDTNISVQKIESDILKMFPAMNKQVKVLSLQWTEKLLIYLELVRRGQLSNFYKFHRDRKKESVFWKKIMTEEEIEWVQVCQRVRNLLLSTPKDSPYSEKIKGYLLSKYLKEREHESEKNGIVPRYMKGLYCQSYTFKNQPESFQEYQLGQKGSDLLIKIEKMLSENKNLGAEQKEVRDYIIKNTGEIKLLNNNSSRGILYHFFNHPNRKHSIKISPTEFISEFNSKKSCRTDDFGYRLHSDVSYLKSNLLKWLRYNGKPLQQLDITCSQPFFLSVISTQLIDILVNDDSKLSFLRKVVPVLQKYESNDDYILFKRLCYLGSVYEHLVKQYELICHEKISRKKMKSLFFYCVFSKIGSHSKLKVNNKNDSSFEESTQKINIIKVFQTSFPSVYNALGEIQQLDFGLPVLKCKNGLQEKHKNTSLMLQRVESSIIYNYVAPILYGLNIFFTTIHDSILVLEQDVNVALALFKVAFLQLGVVVPTISGK